MNERISVLGVNFKMYMDRNETISWLNKVKIGLEQLDINHWEIFILPSAPLIPESIEICSGTSIKIGAQNTASDMKGAFTGEISSKILKDVGCEYVLVGHHERRSIFNESDIIANQKIKNALHNNLIPIICVGERIKEDIAQAKIEIESQLKIALNQVNEQFRHVIAYEPTWAIGADQPATFEHINEMGKFIHSILKSLNYQKYSLIYGGSAGFGQYAEIADVCDGLFLGRSVHDPSQFLKVMKECAELKK